MTGTFSAETGSSITNSTGTDFAISGGTANVTYKDNGRKAGETAVLSGAYSRPDEDHVLLDPCLHFERR